MLYSILCKFSCYKPLYSFAIKNLVFEFNKIILFLFSLTVFNNISFVVGSLSFKITFPHEKAFGFYYPRSIMISHSSTEQMGLQNL